MLMVAEQSPAAQRYGPTCDPRKCGAARSSDSSFAPPLEPHPISVAHNRRCAARVSIRHCEPLPSKRPRELGPGKGLWLAAPTELAKASLLGVLGLRRCRGRRIVPPSAVPENLRYARAAHPDAPGQLRPVRDVARIEHPPPFLNALIWIPPPSSGPPFLCRPTEIDQKRCKQVLT
jgi:hypothetical protein